VILAVDKWKPYLQQQPFTILTDQKSLIHLGEQRLVDGIQHKAFVKLLGLQYRIKYKKGQENKAADALSRQLTHAEMHAISTIKPRWLEIVTEGYLQDDQAKQLLTELSISGTNDKGFSLVDGVIRHMEKFGLEIILMPIKQFLLHYMTVELEVIVALLQLTTRCAPSSHGQA
jgi:hypothetical protein